MDSDARQAHPPGSSPIAVSYDGGIYILYSMSLRQTGEVAIAGLDELSPAGDDRHLIVSTQDRFRILDALDAEFTDIDFSAAEPGHVVPHAGRTTLFADGSGEVITFDPTTLGSGKPDTAVYRAAAAHHGAAIELTNGELVVTLGAEEKRIGVTVLDKDRKEIARNEDCPGAHGSATAENETVVVGCQNGALVYHNRVLRKVPGPTPYGRIGNLVGSDNSAIVLGDFKYGEQAELAGSQQVSLIDTAVGNMRLVDIGTNYTFRSLARGPAAEALVLGTDGRIHVLDPVAGTVSRTIPVIDAWQEPQHWQQPRPALFVRGDMAYVTDPAMKMVHRIDLAAGMVAATATLPAAPNELSGVVPR
ncbi:zinc metallochaperone AztD [Nocardia sp. NPDC049190]|uniref:zinc metallochaperone AztD n=1 Tax=Nocardia sp. NPDC049190 TaxID=3155650 RepID=UPI0033D28C1F